MLVQALTSGTTRRSSCIAQHHRSSQVQIVDKEYVGILVFTLITLGFVIADSLIRDWIDKHK